jgi:uncharacterized alkaline shock family protein YloU
MTYLEDLQKTLSPAWEFTVHYVTQPLVWLICAVGVVLLLWLKIRRARKPIILQRSQGGNLEIARTTLRGLIIGAAQRVSGVHHTSCKYHQKGRKLRVTVFIHLDAQARLPQVEEELKRGIRTTLQQHVGYDPSHVAPIHVRVTKITGDTMIQLPPEEEETEVPALPRYEESDEVELPEGQVDPEKK